MTGLGKSTVQRAVEVLEAVHLLRKERVGWPGAPGGKSRGRSHTYIARERLDVRLGARVLCTVVIDYVPLQVHQRLKALKEALAGGKGNADPALWAQVDIIPGDGFTWDAERKVLTASVHAAEVPPPAEATPGQAAMARARLHELREEIRALQKK